MGWSARYINHGSFGVHGKRIRLLASSATGVFVADDYFDGKRRRHRLNTTDVNEAKKQVAELVKQSENGRPALSSEKEAVLYVVQRGDDGPIKVGISRRLRQRIKQLQTGSAEKLKVLRVYKMSDVERAIHGELERASRLEGEWFPADLLSRIDRFFNVPFDIQLKRARNENRIRRDLASLSAPLDSIHGNTYSPSQGGGRHENQSHHDAERGALGAFPNPRDTREGLRGGDPGAVNVGLSR